MRMYFRTFDDQRIASQDQINRQSTQLHPDLAVRRWKTRDTR